LHGTRGQNDRATSFDAHMGTARAFAAHAHDALSMALDFGNLD
jgi:hypothetical protein